MPDQEGSHDPPRNTNGESLPLTQLPSSIKESMMSSAGSHKTENDKAETSEISREVHWVERATMWSQIALVVLGLFALIVYHGQLSVMQGQLDEMKKSGQSATDQMWQAISNINWLARTMDGSLKESQRASQISELQSRKALDAGIRASRTDQRAWISVGRIGNEAVLFAAGSPFVTNLGMINTGKTPARNVTIRYNAVPIGLGKFPNFGEVQPGDNSGFIGPGSWTHLSSIPGQSQLRNIRQEEFNQVVHKLLTIFVYGRITYDDAFGYHHWNRFCFMFNPESHDLEYCKSKEQNAIDPELR